MSPSDHALLSVASFGGHIDDYMEIHMFLDSTKHHYPDFKHRAILHNSFGVELVEKIFGGYLVNSEGSIISTKTVAEQHIKEDCNGKIPRIDEWILAFIQHSKENWINKIDPNSMEKLKKIKRNNINN